MKALSFRQPWAELILQGRKTVDLRTYNSHYRGPLAIHVAQMVEAAVCRQQGLDPKTLAVGGFVGIVDLVDVVPLNEADYEAKHDQHLAGRSYRPGMYGWVLSNPRRLPALIPAKGRTNLFPVDLDLTVVANQPPALDRSESLGETAPENPVLLQEVKPAVDTPVPPKIERGVAPRRTTKRVTPYQAEPQDERVLLPFRLEVTPVSSERSDFGVMLLERGFQANQSNGSNAPYQPQLMATPLELPEMVPLITLSGEPLRAVADHVIDAIRQAGYKATDLSPDRKKPFYLPEEVGVRLGLILLAIKPLNKLARIEAISYGIRQMSAEEVYYWYSKCTASQSSERAQKALRVLLAAE
jgi:hypothetical protein